MLVVVAAFTRPYFVLFTESVLFFACHLIYRHQHARTRARARGVPVVTEILLRMFHLHKARKIDCVLLVTWPDGPARKRKLPTKLFHIDIFVLNELLEEIFRADLFLLLCLPGKTNWPLRRAANCQLWNRPCRCAGCVPISIKRDEVIVTQLWIGLTPGRLLRGEAFARLFTLRWNFQCFPHSVGYELCREEPRASRLHVPSRDILVGRSLLRFESITSVGLGRPN
jgi:hypothetical protein